MSKLTQKINLNTECRMNSFRNFFNRVAVASNPKNFQLSYFNTQFGKSFFGFLGKNYQLSLNINFSFKKIKFKTFSIAPEASDNYKVFQELAKHTSQTANSQRAARWINGQEENCSEEARIRITREFLQCYGICDLRRN